MLLGEAPSRGGDRFHHFPLSGPPARVLCGLAGIPPVEGGTTYGRWTWALYDAFECRNVFERYRDATPWSAPAARSRVAESLDDLYGRVVVCLGRRPQKALTDALAGGAAALYAPFYTWIGRDVLFAAIPHPSGLNRILNNADERERSGATLRHALELARRAAGVAS